MAICRKAYPWREIEMADRLTGIRESGRFREIPNTIKLQIIEVTRIYKGWNSMLTSLRLVFTDGKETTALSVFLRIDRKQLSLLFLGPGKGLLHPLSQTPGYARYLHPVFL